MTLDNGVILILIILIVVLLALLFKSAGLFVGGAAMYFGGSVVSNDIDDIVIDKLKPLITNFGRKPITKYLEGHFNLSKDKINIGKDYLRDIIIHVESTYKIDSYEDFLLLSAISQASLLPLTKKQILFEPHKYISVTKGHIRDVKKLLEEYLIKNEMYWESDRIARHARDLLTAHRMYRLKSNWIKRSAAQIKKALKKDAEGVLGVDKLAMRPIVRDYVVSCSRAARTSKMPLNDRRDLSLILRALGDGALYPYWRLRNIKTWRDLARLFSESYLAADVQKEIYKKESKKAKEEAKSMVTAAAMLQEDLFRKEEELKRAREQEQEMIKKAMKSDEELSKLKVEKPKDPYVEKILKEKEEIEIIDDPSIKRKLEEQVSLKKAEEIAEEQEMSQEEIEKEISKQSTEKSYEEEGLGQAMYAKIQSQEEELEIKAEKAKEELQEMLKSSSVLEQIDPSSAVEGQEEIEVIKEHGISETGDNLSEEN